MPAKKVDARQQTDGEGMPLRENGASRLIELQPIMDEEAAVSSPLRPASGRFRLRDLRHHRALHWTQAPLVRTAAKNLLLIFTW